MVVKPVQFVARGRFFFKMAAKFYKYPTAIPDTIFQAILFDKWSATCMIFIKKIN